MLPVNKAELVTFDCAKNAIRTKKIESEEEREVILAILEQFRKDQQILLHTDYPSFQKGLLCFKRLKEEDGKALERIYNAALDAVIEHYRIVEIQEVPPVQSTLLPFNNPLKFDHDFDLNGFKDIYTQVLSKRIGINIRGEPLSPIYDIAIKSRGEHVLTHDEQIQLRDAYNALDQPMQRYKIEYQKFWKGEIPEKPERPDDPNFLNIFLTVFANKPKKIFETKDLLPYLQEWISTSELGQIYHHGSYEYNTCYGTCDNCKAFQGWFKTVPMIEKFRLVAFKDQIIMFKNHFGLDLSNTMPYIQNPAFMKVIAEDTTELEDLPIFLLLHHTLGKRQEAILSNIPKCKKLLQTGLHIAALSECSSDQISLFLENVDDVIAFLQTKKVHFFQLQQLEPIILRKTLQSSASICPLLRSGHTFSWIIARINSIDTLLPRSAYRSRPPPPPGRYRPY